MKQISAYLLLLGIFLLATSVIQGQCKLSVFAGEDISLCAPTSPVQLNGEINGDYFDLTWSPAIGMTNSKTLTPTVSVNQTSHMY